MDQAQVTTRRRWLWVVSAVAGLLALTACEAPQPDVTFYGNRVAVDTGPTTRCDVDQQAATVFCPEPAVEDLPRLSLHPGQSVQINVPSAIADGPWWVYFRYLDKDGTLSDGKTSTFTDGRLAFTLTPFSQQDQLVSVEVQNDFLLVAADGGGVDFQPTRSWRLLVDPIAPAGETAADG
jgi:hypothetical protein